MSEKFTLITGRTRAQGDGLHQGRDSKAYVLATHLVEMSEKDMETLALSEGTRVSISTPDGQVEVPVKSGNLPSGMLFMPMGPTANLLIGADTGCTGMPSFKGIPAEVKAV